MNVCQGHITPSPCPPICLQKVDTKFQFCCARIAIFPMLLFRWTCPSSCIKVSYHDTVKCIISIIIFINIIIIINIVVIVNILSLLAGPNMSRTFYSAVVCPVLIYLTPSMCVFEAPINSKYPCI